MTEQNPGHSGSRWEPDQSEPQPEFQPEFQPELQAAFQPPSPPEQTAPAEAAYVDHWASQPVRTRPVSRIRAALAGGVVAALLAAGAGGLALGHAVASDDNGPGNQHVFPGSTDAGTLQGGEDDNGDGGDRGDDDGDRPVFPGAPGAPQGQTGTAPQGGSNT